MTGPLRIAPATVEDAGEMLTLQRAAYVSEAQVYEDPFLPPLVETLEELWSTLGTGGGLVARDGGRLVGAVRFHVADDVVRVGRLTVAPDRQGSGIGSRLLAAVEELGPARRAALFTGHRSEGNLRLYRRCGYAEVRREHVHGRLILVHLEKELPATGPRGGHAAPTGGEGREVS